MNLNFIPLNDHPSNLDQTACLVAEDRGGAWTVYRVKGGYCLVSKGSAVSDLFTTERDAIAVANELAA